MGAWYFRHDYSARNDQKLIELEIEHGAHIGYALWFKLLEVMGEANGLLPKSKLSLFAYAMRIDMDQLNKLICTCERIGLLVDTGDVYINKRFYGEYSKIQSRSKINSDNAKKRWDKEVPEPAPRPKQPSLAPEIIEYWNANAKSLKCKKLTSDIEKAVAKRCKEYTIDEIKQGIENYHSVLNDPDCFFSYKWKLAEFLSRANGFPVFYGDRNEIIGKYRKSVGKNANPEQPKTRKELLEAYK